MTSCGYKIGADLESDVMKQCAHFMAPLYDLLRGDCDGLAEHILLELKARRGSNKVDYDESTMHKLFHDVIQLCIAASVDLKILKKLKSTNMLDDILQEFFAMLMTKRDKPME